MSNSEIKKKLLEIIQKRKCSDGCCIWGPPKGMHTNGGCQSLKSSFPEIRREMRQLAKELLELVEE
jgi:hypothetical protein